MLPTMFCVTEAQAAVIHSVFHQEGELSAAIELRRLFPGVLDNVAARSCARMIAGWTPQTLVAQPTAQVVKLRAGRARKGLKPLVLA